MVCGFLLAPPLSQKALKGLLSKGQGYATRQTSVSAEAKYISRRSQSGQVVDVHVITGVFFLS